MIDEIKPANQALVALLTEMEVVEFSANDSLFADEALYTTWLDKLISSVGSFYSHIDKTYSTQTSTERAKNVDKEILDRYQLQIGIRVTNPILEMHQFCLETSKEQLRDIMDSLLNIFRAPADSNADEVKLSYYQFVALHEVYSSSSSTVSFPQVVKNLLAKHPHGGTNNENESVLFVGSHLKNDYRIEQFRSGELFPTANRYLDPTTSFILQMSDWLQYQARIQALKGGADVGNDGDEDGFAPSSEEIEEDVEVIEKRRKLVAQGERSLDFVLLALEKLQTSKELAEQGASEAAEEIIDELLQKLDNNSDSEEDKLVIPVHTRVLLLLER